MHYYKRNLGDYAKKAGRLSMLQHGAYTLLIDSCYDREQFPTRDEAIDWCWASSSAEIEAVDFVLAKFFTLTDGRFVQTRIAEELQAFHEKSETNARIAQERETKRAQSRTNRARDVNEPPPNQEPRTTNQEPKERESADKPLPPRGRKKSEAKTLAVYIEECRLAKVKPIPAEHSIRRWAEQAGLQADMLPIAWLEFRQRYTEGEKGSGKRYKDWPGHFATAVKDNWFKLWFFSEGEMNWTSVGLAKRAVLDINQKQREVENAAA